MFTKIRMAMLAAAGSVAMLAAVAPSAQAGLLSLTTGACGQQESQPFAQFGDAHYYVPVPGGSFEPGTPSWLLTGGAGVVAGNESYDVLGGSHSLSLPAGSSATSPPACTGLDHPSARFFVRNTGSPSSRLTVWATYRLALGLPYTVHLGSVSGAASWNASTPVVMGLVNNVLGSATLSQSVISFTFVPADASGNWQIDDVFLDPFCRR